MLFSFMDSIKYLCTVLILPCPHFPDCLTYAIAFPWEQPTWPLKVPMNRMTVLQSPPTSFSSLYAAFLSISKIVKAERRQHFKQKAIVLKELPNN
jgi:hypothetical protein